MHTAATTPPLLPATLCTPNPPVHAPKYPRDITLYSAAVLNDEALFHKILSGEKIYELRKRKISVKRPYVVFHPNAQLQKLGFFKHILAHIFNVETKFNTPFGAMDFSLLCKYTRNGLDLGFDSPHKLQKHMNDSSMTEGYLYPIKYPREEEIVWTKDSKFTSLYNQVFLTESYLHKQATPSNPHVWLFWFPESPPGQHQSYIKS
jgi:hypothetical protein